MSDNSDKRLEMLLQRQPYLPESAGFQQRILLQARQTPQQRSMPWSAWLAQCFDELFAHKPAYAVASLLILGFFAGVTLPEVDADADISDSYIQAMLYGDEVEL